MHTALRYSKVFGEFSDCSPEPLPEGDMLPFKPTSHCQRNWIWTKLETSKTKAAVKKKATDSKYTLQTFKYCAVSSSTAFHPKMSSKVKKKKK